MLIQGTSSEVMTVVNLEYYGFNFKFPLQIDFSWQINPLDRRLYNISLSMVIIIVLHQSEWDFYSPHLLPPMLCDKICHKLFELGFNLMTINMVSQCDVNLLVGGRYTGKGGPGEPGGERTKEHDWNTFSIDEPQLLHGIKSQ